MSDYSILLVDGATFKPNKHQVKFIQTNSSINSFIESGQDSSKALIVGQKGSGKSVIIRYKRYIDATQDTENKFFIPSEGIEKIDFSDQLSASELTKNVKYQDWEKIFKVSIYYFILCKLKDQIIENKIIPEEKFDEIVFHDLLNPMRIEFSEITFGSILYKCVTNRSIIYDNNADFIDDAKHIIKVFIKKREVRVYLDNLDQALHTSLTKEDSKKRENYGKILNIEENEILNSIGKERIDLENFISIESFDLSDKSVAAWFTCHIGFLLAIYSVNDLSRRINVYSTFRLEASEYFEYIKLKNKPQYRNILSKIDYTDQDFKNIYLNLLAAAEIKEIDLEILSLNKLPHLYVKNESRKNELLWEFVKRHTFSNPREITFQIRVLKKIVEDYKNQINNKDEIRNIFKQLVSDRAFSLIITDLYSETLPFFPSIELSEFYNENKRNYVSNKDLTDHNKSLIVILYRLGLVGVLIKKGNKLKQKFLSKNVYYTNEKQTLPDSEFYLFHPTLDHILLDRFPNCEFYYPWCIIGNGLDFEIFKELEYYLPKIKNKKGSEHFESFYKHPNSFERYQAIENSIIKDWAPKIWDYIFDPNLKNKWFKYLSGEVNNGEGFHGLRKVNKIKNTNSITRNYKLRIVICLSSLSGLIKDHKEFKDTVFIKHTFPNITYFGNIQGHGNKLSRYLSFLSDFELNIINKVIENPEPSEKLMLRFKTNIDYQNDFYDLLSRMKNQLSSYKN